MTMTTSVLTVDGAASATSAHARATRVRVLSKQIVAEGICAVTLGDVEGARLPDWTPGSHIDLMLPGGLVRQYSLCGDRRDAHTYRIAVLREPASRGGSDLVHDELAVGTVLDIGGPRNNFRLVPGEHHLFVAGGIGITPILAMIRAAEAMPGSWTLLYGGRTRSSMAFLEELVPFGDRVRIAPQDEEGLLDLQSAIADLPAGGKVYCCGPAPLLAAIEAACAELPPQTLHVERFVAEEQPPPARSTAFDVEIASTGACVTVHPGVAVLDALSEAGVRILASCRSGLCGTCETGVLSGTPDHRDSLLDDEERRRGDTMMVCVSRSTTDRLVLDV